MTVVMISFQPATLALDAALLVTIPNGHANAIIYASQTAIVAPTIRIIALEVEL